MSWLRRRQAPKSDDELAPYASEVLAAFEGGPRGRVERDVRCRANHPPALVEMHRGGEADIYTLMPGTAATYRYVRTVNRSAADR